MNNRSYEKQKNTTIKKYNLAIERDQKEQS